MGSRELSHHRLPRPAQQRASNRYFQKRFSSVQRGSIRRNIKRHSLGQTEEIKSTYRSDFVKADDSKIRRSLVRCSPKIKVDTRRTINPQMQGNLRRSRKGSSRKNFSGEGNMRSLLDKSTTDVLGFRVRNKAMLKSLIEKKSTQNLRRPLFSARNYPVRTTNMFLTPREGSTANYNPVNNSYKRLSRPVNRKRPDNLVKLNTIADGSTEVTRQKKRRLEFKAKKNPKNYFFNGVKMDRKKKSTKRYQSSPSIYHDAGMFFLPKGRKFYQKIRSEISTNHLSSQMSSKRVSARPCSGKRKVNLKINPFKSYFQIV